MESLLLVKDVEKNTEKMRIHSKRLNIFRLKSIMVSLLELWVLREQGSPRC